MLEDVKSWVAMDSYEQHLINNMSVWIENLPTVEVSDEDCISRQAAIDAIRDAENHAFNSFYKGLAKAHKIIADLPSAQPERDIPIKPNETTDTAWGIPNRQAVCPKCDCYLGHVEFLGDYNGKKVTYCETCGQAIDWEEWSEI